MVTAEPPDERRMTAKGRATRERIVQAAAEVVLAEGLSELSLDKVRKAASVSGSQLTHYYADKQSLIRAVVERQIEDILDFHRQPNLGGLETLDDFERWIDLSMRHVRRIGYDAPTYHALTGQLAKTDDATRRTLADGYAQWVELLAQSFQRMKDHGVLVKRAKPRQLALVAVAAHQGSATIAFTYRQEWAFADTLRFVVNHVRMFAADDEQRTPRRPRRPRDYRRPAPLVDDSAERFTRKGSATRARIVAGAAQLMFDHGVKSVSLKDVRSAVGVSGSQLSHYFADKRDLTRQVIAARTDDVVEFHTQPAFGELDSLRALRAWSSACMAQVEKVYLRGGCVYGSLSGELFEADCDVRDDLAAGYDAWLRLFQNGVAQMRRRGDLIDGADPRHLAVALLAAHQGGAMLTHTTKRADPFEVTVNAAVDYVRSFRPTQRSLSRRP